MQSFKNYRGSMLAAVLATGMAYRDEAVGQTGTGETAATPAPVPAAPNDYTRMQKQNFHFKKSADVKGTDAEGKEVIVEAGSKHPTVEMYLPVPTTARLIEILQNPEKFVKEVELINSSIFDVIYTAARGQINDIREKDPKATITPAALDYDKLDFTAIANTPRAERGAYAPSDEEIKAFCESYLAVMPAATQKPEATIKNHVTLIKDGFKKQKSQKEILELFVGMFSVYATAAPADVLEEHASVVEYFINKLNKWLTAEEKITMDML